MREQLLARVSLQLFAVLACVVLGACSKKLDGPTPEVAAPMKNAKALPVDPGIVCRDQLTTEVTVHGEGFSPIPIDIPKSPRLIRETGGRDRVGFGA
jgi:hypothetical protein